jgi:3-methyladenine DNA glycosylase/8-oxoguanine DNA glycosylase
VNRAEAAVECTAWGSGAEHLLHGLPTLLGAGDDVSGFDPEHPVLRESWRRHSGWRVPRTERVMEALVPAILEQKVTGMEARRSWRRLLLKYGDPAPGPAPEGMRVPPDAKTWARIPSWEWHRSGVGPQRSRTVVCAALVGDALERTVGMQPLEVEAKLRSVSGVGAWTSAEVRQRAHGDPDAVSVGDFHIPAQVGLALIGQPVDDDGMLELLEPWAGHRYRVIRMIELAGISAPRRGPRYAPIDHRNW